MRLPLHLVVLLAGICPAAAPAGDFQAIAEKTAPPEAIADAITEVLGDDSIRVRHGADDLCTVWFRKSIRARATAEQAQNGLTYREIPTGALVGVIHLPRKWIDFRKQEIPPGVYTLRLAIQPTSDDHSDTAPHKEFCLLCAADRDVKPDPLEMKTLVELSAASHDAKHPAVLLLFPNLKPAEAPEVSAKGNGLFVLSVKRSITAEGATGFIGFALTIAGHRAD